MDGMLEFSFAKASLQNFVTCQSIFVQKTKKKKKKTKRSAKVARSRNFVLP
jgi:hypothetical protein